VVRLADHLENVAPADASRRCWVADESRRALGCPRRRNVLSATRPFPEGKVLTVEARLPAELAAGRVVLVPSLISDEALGWKRTSPVVLEGVHPGVTLEIPIPGDLKPTRRIRIRVTGQAVPDRPATFRTRPWTVGARSTLAIGLAIDPLAAEVGAASTVFRIDALGAFGRREILHAVIPPEEAQERWIDRRVDLTPLTGETVRFELGTEVAPSGDGRSSTGWSLPIWGNPQILQLRPRGDQRNVILVSLDTMRGDFARGEYEGRRLTPGLDARAREGAAFRQAVAPYPSTSASHMSIFTSTYPAEHKVLHAKHVLSRALPTLAQILAANAFETAAFTEDGMLAAAAGFERGFDQYDENRGVSMWDARGDIEHTLDRGLRWLGNHRGEKLFLFLHSYQVHRPYEPPPAYDLFASGPAPGERPRVARMRNLYAGEVVYTDRVIGRLFDTVRRLGLAGETIVVVTADHGEEFGEHGSVGHSRTVYDEVLRVPLVFWAPGAIPAGVEIDTQVSLIDLAPTLLDLVHVPPPPTLRGQSLAPALLHGRRPTPAVRFAEGPALQHRDGRLFSARTGRYKWITRGRQADPVEIYDLQANPGETRNLAGDAELRARGRRILQAYRDLDASTTRAGADREVDPRTQNKLRALGYVD